MISRRTTLLVAEVVAPAFTRYKQVDRYSRGYYAIDGPAVYDFFFENDYPAWVCNAARG